MEQNKIIKNMPANDRPKRNSKPVTRLVDEYSKYTTGKYHGWRDTYDRGYDGGRKNFMGYRNKNNDTSEYVFSNK